MEQTEEKKEFEAFPVRTLRASDEIWELFKQKRNKSGKTWNKFLLELVNK